MTMPPTVEACPGVPLVCRVPTEAEAEQLARTEPDFVRPIQESINAATVQERRQPLHASEPRQAEEAEPSAGCAGLPESAQEPVAPLIALSDWSQDREGYAVLAGRPLPADVRLRLEDGWTQPGPIEVCAECGHGCVTVNPKGVPQHRSCAWARGRA